MHWPAFFCSGTKTKLAPAVDPDVCRDDFLLVTWDSCRFDTYQKARTPHLDAFGPAHRAWAMATYTLPAHAAMFHGFLPHAFETEPFYNRHVQQLWRISHRNTHAAPLIAFPPRTKNIANGFENLGYYTAGVAAMSMFKHASELRRGFADFTVTKESEARRQNDVLITQLKSKKAANKPIFAFVNYGETHSPFRHQDMTDFDPTVEEQFSHSRLFNQQCVKKEEWTFNHAAFEKQVSCAEFLDARTGELIDFLKHRGRPSTVVVCADHGECFGEHGLYGHAFYHEKVMEVPLLIFRVNAPPHPKPEVVNEPVEHHVSMEQPAMAG